MEVNSQIHAPDVLSSLLVEYEAVCAQVIMNFIIRRSFIYALTKDYIASNDRMS
jgi:hypothetical protein